ncbi:MAG TPA: GNAT family protein [Methylomirabilota bacterium]|nr:GNAT family protein [Methylomirabilota bacterium]
MTRWEGACRPGAGGGEVEREQVIARGRRVYLRTLVPADLESLSEWADTPFLERMVGSEFLRTFKHAYDKDPSFYEAVLSDPSQVVLVIMAVDQREPRWKKPLGLVRLFSIHVQEGYAFLETLLGDQQAIRHGFGVEAGKLICAYGMDVLGLRRIEAKVYEYNRLSVNSLLRHGFRQEGVLRKAGFFGGEHYNVLVFGILREELEAQRETEVDQDSYHFPFTGPIGIPDESA